MTGAAEGRGKYQAGLPGSGATGANPPDCAPGPA